MQLSFDLIRKYFEHRHPGQRIPAREKCSVCCVLHGETNPSCTLYLDGNGGFNCHACGAKGNLFQFEAALSGCDLKQAEINVAAITGATPSLSHGKLGPPVAFYDYRDESGKLLFQKRRFEPELGPKQFRQFHMTEKGWVSQIDPANGQKTRRVLYNLPSVVKANVVLLAEGEKDADNLTSAGLFAKAGWSIAATSTFAGAGKKDDKHPKWLEIYNPYFCGKVVIIFADNDDPGRVHAENAAAGIAPFAYSLRVVHFLDLPEKSDVSDFLLTHSVAELEQRIKDAPPWTGQVATRENWLVEAVGWSSTTDAKVDWMVEDIIQRGANGIIAAEPKTGKSLVALDLLLSLATGTPWLGHAVKERVRVAYISREDSPILTKGRVRGFLQNKGFGSVDPAEWLWCNTREQLATFDINNDDNLKTMAHDLKERGVEFTILDVLNRIHSCPENDNTEMAKVVERISQMGREAGCYTGVVHHVSKENNTGRFFTRIRGASAIHGWTEWSIGLSLENTNSDDTKLIRKAEFETKAAAPCPPILFTIQSENNGLKLLPVDYVPPAVAEAEAQTNSQLLRFQKGVK